MTNKSKKHIVSLVLMTSSILLLLVFQYFWLSQVYENEKRTLIKETDITFRNVVSAMQDSLIQKNMKSLNWGDSNVNFQFKTMKRLSNIPPPIFFGKDCVKTDVKIVLPKGKLQKDSVKVVGSSEIQIMIASDKSTDSANQIVQSIIKNRPQELKTKSFMIRIGEDTLPKASIIFNYQKALSKAKIDLGFELKVSKHEQASKNFNFGEELKQPDNGIVTNQFFCLPPSPVYQAYFPDAQLYILRKMLTQFLFSLGLIILTSGAFFLIYNNLQRQERLITLKNDFISNVTHELKTPVTTVSVAIEALQSFNALQNPDLTKEYLEISQNELNRLAMLVDKIMKMSSFESKGIELKLTSINIQQLVNQILKSMKLQFEKHMAEVQLEVIDGEATLLADEVHLTNVIYNLLDNALKYSKENPKIQIELQGSPDKIRLSVQDNGIGISPEYKGKIFEKFFRVPTGNVHNIKGYGLGLSYVASVVQQHGGKIEVESKLGEGSNFTIVLPKKNV